MVKFLKIDMIHFFRIIKVMSDYLNKKQQEFELLILNNDNKVGELSEISRP